MFKESGEVLIVDHRQRQLNTGVLGGKALDLEVEPRECRLEGVLRSLTYACTGALAALFAVAWFIGDRLEHEPLSLPNVMAFSALIFGCVLMCLAVNVCRLRIDCEGVHLWRLTGWDLWTWEEFQSGKVEATESMVFVDPRRPSLRRKLHLGLFEHYVDNLCICCKHWIPPDIKMPEKIQITFFLRRVGLQFSAQGISVKNKKGNKIYDWNELMDVTLTCFTQYHQDFKSAILHFPDQTIAFGSTDGTPSKRWRGPGPRIIEAFIREHSDGSRIHVKTKQGLPSDVQDLEDRLGRVRTQMRRLPLQALYIGAVVTFFASAAAVASGVGRIEAVVISLAVAGVPLTVFSYRLGKRDWRTLLEKMEAYRKELPASADVNETPNDDGERLD